MTDVDGTPSWENLWDQIDSVSNYTQKGIEHLEKFAAFLKDRATIETEYAAKLRALVKKNLSKKKEDEDLAKTFTYFASLDSMLHELESFALQHEAIAEQLRKDIYPSILSNCASLRAKRKTNLNELNTLNTSLNATIECMVKTQKSYNKAFKEAECAYIKYDKAEKNMDLSRAELVRAKNNATQRAQQCEEARKSYAHALETANTQQSMHYGEMLPKALEQLRQVDEERILQTRNFMLQSIEAETRVMPIMQRCYDDMAKAANNISSNNDSAAVVEQFRTGYSQPEPFAFEDLGPPEAVLHGDGTSIPSVFKISKNGTNGRTAIIRKTSLFKPGSKKEGPIESLPPQQRCRRLKKEIDKLKKEVERNEQSAEGLRKMHQIYTENPKMGSAKDVEAQIAVYKRKADSLLPQIEKYEEMYSAAETEMKAYSSTLGRSDTSRSYVRPTSGMSTPPVSPNSGLNTAVSTPSQASSSHGLNTFGSTAEVLQRASFSGESVSSAGSFGANAAPLNNAVDQKVVTKLPVNNSAPLAEKSEVYEDFEALPVLGTGKALYTFEGGSEGTIPMNEGDEMDLIERDEGDGWTRVRDRSTGHEGFVPTTYLECKWYS
uniref:Formin-binding protein 1-like n=1 Tax=Syphacia muris TaxID=451379 RepID=A0A0N5B0I1_9BILA